MYINTNMYKVKYTGAGSQLLSEFRLLAFLLSLNIYSFIIR